MHTQKILGNKTGVDGKPVFLVKWMGHSHDKNTWEPLSAFKDTSIVVTYLLNQGPNPTQGTSSARLPDNKDPDVRSDSKVEEGETTSDSGADYDDDEEEWNDGEFDTDDQDGTSDGTSDGT